MTHIHRPPKISVGHRHARRARSCAEHDLGGDGRGLWIFWVFGFSCWARIKGAGNAFTPHPLHGQPITPSRCTSAATHSHRDDGCQNLVANSSSDEVAEPWQSLYQHVVGRLDLTSRQLAHTSNGPVALFGPSPERCVGRSRSKISCGRCRRWPICTLLGS